MSDDNIQGLFSCEDCLWYGVCQPGSVCDDFSPSNDEINNTYVDEIIKINKEEFYDEWIEYIGECGD